MFFSIVLIVVGPIHWYLYKRLVKDTTTTKRGRRIGAVAIIALAVALLAAFIVPRAIGAKASWVIPMVGYMWLAVLFYLMVTLLVLEIPRVIANRTWARRPAARTPVTADSVAATVPAAAPGTGSGGSQTLLAEPGLPAAAEITGPAGQVDESETPNATGAGQVGGSSAEPTRGGPADPSRRLLIARSAAIFAGLTATGITAYGVKTALGDPVLKRVQIPLAKLPRSMDGYKIALVSDIHLGPLTGIEHSRRIVRSINGMNADLIAVAGDMVDGTVAELGDEAAPLAELRSRDGAYFVTGNHEYFSGAEEWLVEVERLGMRPLQNERLDIRGLTLAGVNDVSGGDLGEGGPDFGKALDGRDPGKPVVLLAHQPIQAFEAAKHGVDLQLSGHTHGGQMVPFNLIAALQQPVISGLGEVDGTQVYVTNGAGFWGPPVRVGAPPDITLVELRAM
ncbi:metallophosphoesterase [Catellatospora paridis]|uniref:metallophosphoesterase n=1 Tax=Catellatospora paridis TaxID=1617086 RepID=UPI0012D411CF|nr:metallophosphoesterase [Catellatospora paridis]